MERIIGNLNGRFENRIEKLDKNLIYGKIKSHFNINTKDFGLHINHFTSEEDEYLESLEITNIIKKDQ